jgi:carbamoyl-phosphate synthase small subunit
MQEIAHLVLVDGSVWPGRPFGARGQHSGEVVFNTSMTGYQEILTDPSYCRQIVVMTAPHIGNTGVNDEDDESDRSWVSGFVVRRASLNVSSWRATGSLDDYLRERGVVGIDGVDTRALVRHIRDRGAMHGAIVSDGSDAEAALAIAKAAPDINSLDLVGEVSCAAAYEWTEPADPRWYPLGLGGDDPAGDAAAFAAAMRVGDPPPTPVPLPGLAPAGVPDDAPRVVVYDFGVKRNTLRLLAARGQRVTVVPARTPAEQVLAMRPDGILLSNGPGDPARLGDVVDNVRALVGRVPIFGICLGHQLLGLALGGRTYKLKFGHRGGNQPVKGPEPHVAISSQNHGFALAEHGMDEDVAITHRSLNDQSVEGLACEGRRAFSVQYHPEAAPGPHDAADLFDRFHDAITAHTASAAAPLGGVR